jgi:sulfur relay (sulfurtransferase) complex TusBCD TusD component (DsrE family)
MDARSRGDRDADGAKRSTLDELTQLTISADKVIVF